MNRCTSCKWWDTETYDGQREPQTFGRGACLLTRTETGEPEHPESAAFVIEGDGYWGALFTLPEFGCVQWEAKEPRP